LPTPPWLSRSTTCFSASTTANSAVWIGDETTGAPSFAFLANGMPFTMFDLPLLIRPHCRPGNKSTGAPSFAFLANGMPFAIFDSPLLIRSHCRPSNKSTGAPSFAFLAKGMPFAIFYSPLLIRPAWSSQQQIDGCPILRVLGERVGCQDSFVATLLSSNRSPWRRRPPLCHPDRSVAKRRNLQSPLPRSKTASGEQSPVLRSPRTYFQCTGLKRKFWGSGVERFAVFSNRRRWATVARVRFRGGCSWQTPPRVHVRSRCRRLPCRPRNRRTR